MTGVVTGGDGRGDRSRRVVTGVRGDRGAAGRAAPVRLALDAARCDGHGICALRCPELVSLDRFGFASVDGAAIESATVRRRALRAAAACPEGALAVVGSETPPAPLRPVGGSGTAES